jgi:hypothetical protein
MAKKHIKKNEDNQYITWVILIIGIAILLWKFSNISGQTIIIIQNNTVLQQLASPGLPNAQCSLSLDKAVYNVGEPATGTINGPGNTQCNLYSNYNSEGWQSLGIYSTNPYGHLSSTKVMNTPGQFEFAAICGNCVTNHDSITVVGVQQSAQDKYYCCLAMGVDACYKTACPPAGILVYQDFFNTNEQCSAQCGNQVPVQQQQTGCVDSDYGANAWTTTGTCTFNGEFISDTCQDGSTLLEYACEPLQNPTGCGYTTVNCPGAVPGSICSGGKCVVQQISVCAQNCININLMGVHFNTGACFAYNPNGAVSMAQTCVNNNGVYANAIGCQSGQICCCR